MIERKMKPKKVYESLIDYYPKVIVPNVLNAHQTIHGGEVFKIADELAGDVARRHSGIECVTAHVDEFDYLYPAKQGKS